MYEIRIRVDGDDKEWKYIKPLRLASTDISRKCAEMFTNDVKEIRWNKVGRSQGHYLDRDAAIGVVMGLVRRVL